jgi:hypothetical protein
LGNGEDIEFSEEFRAERFTERALVIAALRARVHHDVQGTEADGKYFMYLNLLIADKPFWNNGECWTKNLIPEFTQNLVGGDLCKIAKGLADEMRSEGWTLGIDTSVGNHFLQAFLNGEKVAGGPGAVHGPKEWEARLINLADALSPEVRSALLETLKAVDSESRAWVAQVGA